MKRGHKQEGKMKGVALIVVIGVLSLLVIIGTYFAINMQLEQKAAANYLNSVKAKYLAELGIQKTIADIRNHVKTDSYSNLINYITNYSTAEQEISGIGTYRIFIGKESANVGEDEKINLNALDDTDSTSIDDLYDLELSYDDIAALIDYKDADTDETTSLNTSSGWVSCSGGETNAKNSAFTTLQEIRLVSDNIDDKYDDIKDSLTIFGPIIRGGLLAEYYDNITGASPNVSIEKSSFVGKVVELGEVCRFHWIYPDPMPGADGDGAGWVETFDAEWAGGHLLSDIDTFAVIFRGYIEILPDEVGSSVTFYLSSDDGSRLYIDGEEVVDNWSEHAMEERSGNYTFDYAGWHPIRLEYYENFIANSCSLKWSLTDGANDEYASGRFIPAERLGYHPLIAHPQEAAFDKDYYPQTGIYKLISIGRVGKVESGSVSNEDLLAEKKIETVAKIFGVWTQTTREEFYAAWFSDPGDKIGTTEAWEYYEGDCSDGWICNVNWLDTCPDNASDDLEAGGYNTTPNALKLGYWNDFGDLAYGVVTLTAMAKKKLEGPNIQAKPGTYWVDYWWQAYRNRTDPGGIEYFALTYDYLEGWGTNPRLKLETETFTELHFEVNYNYYRPVDNIFCRAWTACNEYPSHHIGWRGNGTEVPVAEWWLVKIYGSGDEEAYYYDVDNDGYQLDDPQPVYCAHNNADEHIPQVTSRVYIYDVSDSSTGTYWQPVASYTVPFLYPRGERQDFWEPVDKLFDSCGSGYYTIVFDEDGWVFPGGDRLEITLSSHAGTDRWWAFFSTDYYKLDNVLGMIKGSSSNAYKAYLDGGTAGEESVELSTSYSIVTLPNFKFKSNNAYTFEWYMGKVVWMRGAPYDSMTSYWDNIRFIPDNGFLVSRPFYAGEEVEWGWLSWTDNTAATSNVDVLVEIRTADEKTGLSSDKDAGFSACANGAQISAPATDPWLQYKVTLETTALNKDDYINSGKTPIFKDITITYLPEVEILFYREITEQ